MVDGIRALCLIYTSCNDAKKKFKIRRTDSVYDFKKQLKAVLRKSLGKKPKLNEHPQKIYQTENTIPIHMKTPKTNGFQRLE